MKAPSKLEQMLGRVFDGVNSGLRDELDRTEYAKRRHEFVFHMTDWSSDLEELSYVFENPEKLDDEAVSTFVIGFLYHVIPHLKAAGRLLLDEVPDAFAAASSVPNGRKVAEPKKNGQRIRRQKASAK